MMTSHLWKLFDRAAYKKVQKICLSVTYKQCLNQVRQYFLLMKPELYKDAC